MNKAELIAQYSQLPLNSDYMRQIAHDVRNWMNTVIMANDLLHDELQGVNNDSVKYVDMISRASAEILVVLEAAVMAAEQGQENASSPNGSDPSA